MTALDDCSWTFGPTHTWPDLSLDLKVTPTMKELGVVTFKS